MASENYPLSEFYVADELITKMGIGEAMVTALNEKGMPTELVHTMMRPPFSRMDILTDREMDDLVRSSELVDKYNREIDRESAFEILSERIAEQDEKEERERREKEWQQQNRYAPRSGRTTTRRQASAFEQIMKSPVTRTVAREVARGLLGVLGLKRR